MTSLLHSLWVETRDWGIGWCTIFLIFLPTMVIWYTIAYDLGN